MSVESSPKRAGRACNRSCCANKDNDVPRGQACNRRAACCVHQCRRPRRSGGSRKCQQRQC
eukprot:6591453-Alexandrium_andersonii.AAC.1